MTDPTLFDAPPTNRCDRCDQPAPRGVALCEMCRHLDHRTSVVGCPWCLATTSQAAAGEAGADASADADPAFTEAAKRAAIQVRNRREPFTTLDIRAELAAQGVEITRPHALGSVLRGMSRGGVIRRTGRVVESTVPGQHGRTLTEWVAV